MDFRKTEEQELMLESLRELLAVAATESYIAECDAKEEYTYEMNKALIDNGFALIGAPEKYGGSDADLVMQCMMFEEIAKTGAPASNLIGVIVAINDALAFGSEQQIQETLEITKKSGAAAFSLAITEPQAGSDNDLLAATATRKNGKVYINGHKTFISGAYEYPNMMVVTRDLDNPNPKKAMSMWLIPNAKDTPGVTLKRMHKVGVHMCPTYEVYLENVELEEKDLLGVENKGFMQLMENFEQERLVLCATNMGWAQAVFEDAARYANQRVQFGQPIGSFQLIQEKLVDMATKIENMRNMVYKCAWDKDNGISIQISSALAKRYCMRSTFETIDDAMQILGGIGYTMDHRIQRLWRDCRCNRIGAGTDEIMIHVAGRGILKQYK